ncbi:MAG: radical SAM protein [Candidatus Omnitrophota bacterium]|nr:radical SAM protein [Candidatus Omnitrophota bacterium]
MKVALIDLKESRNGCNNKDKAGGFGNKSHGEDLISRIYAYFKHSQVDVPVMHFGYMAAIFRQHGHTVKFYDAEPEDEELVIMASSIVGYDEELSFARRIQKPGRKIGFINAFATVKPEIFLNASDFVIKGEPEQATIEIAKGNVKPEGVIDSALIFDLESLPFPDWDGFPVSRYGYYPVLKKKPLISILTSRGCSFDCSYCPYMVTQTERWRRRSAKHVCDEIEYLQKKYKVRSLVFRDIMYTQSKQRAIQISEEIIRRGIRVEWSCETRADCLEEDTLRLLHRSGLRVIHLGIESPEDQIVKDSGRIPIKEMQQEKIVRLCEKIGIDVIGFYILGFVADTQKSMRRTIDYAKHLNTPLAQFDVMTPYPGTKFYDEMRDRILSHNWKEYTTHHPVVRLDNVSHEEVLDFKNRAYREYYFRSSWMLKHGLKTVLG